MNKQEAYEEMEYLVYDIENAASRIQQIMREHFPDQYQTGMAYEAFACTSSSNRYNVTLETLLESCLKQEDEEEYA